MFLRTAIISWFLFATISNKRDIFVLERRPIPYSGGNQHPCAVRVSDQIMSNAEWTTAKTIRIGREKVRLRSPELRSHIIQINHNVLRSFVDICRELKRNSVSSAGGGWV